MNSFSPYLICALVLSSAVSVPAATVYSTLGQSVDQFYNFHDAASRWASDFHTGSDPSTITAITIAMTNPDSIDHHFTFALYTENSGGPGTLVETFDGTIAVPALTFPRTDFSTTDAGIGLAADTTYWLVVGINENLNASTSIIASTDSLSPDAGSVFSPVNSTLELMSVDGGADLSQRCCGQYRFCLSGHDYCARA